MITRILGIWGSIRDNFLRYWFYISALALAGLYLLLQRKEMQLADALDAAKTAILGQKLQKIQDKAEESQDGYDKALKDYQDLKRLHGDIIDRLGLLGGPDKK